MAGIPADLPCCVVVDSSALMDNERDVYKLLSQQLRSSPHVIVIPRDVEDELYGLQRCAKGNTSSQAEDMLKLFAQHPQHRQRPSAAPATPKNAGPSTAFKMRGVIVKQRQEETFYPLEKFARNRDTRIVACAHFFTVDPNAALHPGYDEDAAVARDDEAGGAPSSELSDSLTGLPHVGSAPASPNAPSSSGSGAAAATLSVRRFGCAKSFFVTNDLVQQLKASAYGIPTIDAAALRTHFEHLGRYEP